MDTTQVDRRTLASAAVRTASISAVLGAGLGALAALLAPSGNQGEVIALSSLAGT